MSSTELTNTAALSSPCHDPHTFSAGMRCVDTTDNKRIGVLMEMVGALSRATDPADVLRVYSAGVAQLGGSEGYISLSTRNLRPGEYRITRMLLDASDMSVMASADPWRGHANLPVHTGGFFGHLIRTAYPQLIQHLKLLNDPVLGDKLAHFGSMMAVPLFDDGEPLNWAILLKRDPEAFTMEDLEESILRSNLVGGKVKYTLLAKQLRDANERIRGEMQQIARIQRSLLPQSLPHIPGLSIATSYETFDTAGGDLYDFRLLGRNANGQPDPTGPLAMLIADAAGHGPAAAVVTAMLNAILYAYPYREGDGPASVLAYANEHLYAKRLEGTFVTAFLAQYNPATRELTYARAGHTPPLLKNPASSDGSVARLDAVGGIPLGVLDNTAFENATITLQPGQTLVMYTDGITEAMSPRGEMFGVEGIERALEQCSGEPACVVNSLTTALREHEDGVRPADDQTIVAVKVGT